jgi:hypothetical protein
MHNEKIRTRKIIVNKNIGIFEYSTEFYKKFKVLYNHEIDVTTRDTIKIRSDPKCIKVFELLGRHTSSSILSDLKIVYIPEELLPYVELSTKNGYDSLKINYNKAYTDLLFEILDNNNISDSSKDKFNRIKYIQENFNKKKINLFDFIN